MELRKDYLLNRWSIISERRNDRPHTIINIPESEKTKSKKECFFCPGNEEKTPNEVYKKEKEGKWFIRVIPNKFPAADSKASEPIQTHNNYYTFSNNHGHHEIVIETPDHDKKLGDLDEEHISNILKTYADRVSSFNDSRDKYVCIFKNQGNEAGASISHSHSQIIVISLIPPIVSEKLSAVSKYSFCPYCDIINREKGSDRRCFENDTFASFTPYASIFNYELLIFPKQHIKDFSTFSDKTYSDLASIIKKAVSKLEKEGFDYDMAYYYSPDKENLHFHVEIIPRISKWAGFEVGFGTDIVTISPENAAKFYRGE